MPVSGRAGPGHSLPVYSVTKHAGFVPQRDYFKKQVASVDTTSYKVVRAGQFAYATIHLDEGSIGFAPEDCIVSPMYTVFAVDSEKVDTTYLSRMLRSPQAIARYGSLGRGSAERRKSISLKALGTLRVPLPDLPEQRRIAAILDAADAIRAKRRVQLAHLDALPQAVFREMFTNQDRPAVPLGSLAAVASGITKGRRTTENVQPVPYLAVANVQAGRLALESVKTIEATTSEIARYALREGDVVLTEGGDPDKLGRGAVWRAEISPCLHQNHVFRVRFEASAQVLPEYFAAFLQQPESRRYFLRSAKQTTGIASINMTQLRALPVPVPPTAQQRAFLAKVEAIHAERARVARALEADDELFAALQHRAFRGEL